jgi:hypothetical protein
MPPPASVRDAAVAKVERFCHVRAPHEMGDEYRLEHTVRGGSITIVERRPPWSKLVGPEWTSLKVAQLRYDERTRTWSLFCSDSNDRWWPYDGIGPAADVAPLLAEIDEDPTGIFWG